MSEHTPGPWFLINECCVGGPIEPGWEAAGCGIAHCGMRARTQEEAAANARLIAAAPEMFEALTKLLHYFGGPQGVSMQDLGRDAYVSLEMEVRIGDLIDANAALAKARPSPVQQTGGAE
jgi:hypothetical protein